MNRVVFAIFVLLILAGISNVLQNKRISQLQSTCDSLGARIDSLQIDKEIRIEGQHIATKLDSLETCMIGLTFMLLSIDDLPDSFAVNIEPDQLPRTAKLEGGY